MRIGIDARFYGSVGKGLGRYTSELIAHLETLDTENEYVIFLRKSNFHSYRPQSPRFTKVLAEYPWYGWREQVAYPALLNAHKLDLVHFPHFNVPFFYRKPFVVTIHDLILLSHPTTRATTLGPLLFWIKFLLYRLVIGRAIADAKTILTVSETTKREIVKRFPSAQRKPIAVTYEACASAIAEAARGSARAEAPGAFAAMRGQDAPPFMLYVGNAYPHKNLERLIAAFTLFRNAGHQDWKLVLVGAEDYFYARLKADAQKRGPDDHVTFYGHATDEALADLYRTASFYVFPSLCEGFGLPPLEAMCQGLPVTSSNASCMPEILGDAAHYFDPNTPESIAAGMAALADDAALRAALAERGRRHAATFDWSRCAQQTLAAYKTSLHAG